ncbi:DUF1570 domain-containing protein [Pirellulales bacterium]|nr:DUF1570 domain-containing protein [Pirellulales bacterium]
MSATCGESIWRAVIGFVGFIAATTPVMASGPAPFMMQTSVGGQRIEGQPLIWNKSRMTVLGRDGALYEFAVADAQKSTKTASRYSGYNHAELKQQLRTEFDLGFEVTATQHFVVVHPRGQWRAWADRLEMLYRSFVRYMSVRGFRPTTPATPLPAIVFRDREDYYRYAAASGTPLAAGTLGHYSPRTNRIYLFDISASSADADLATNLGTIIHEATHQTAYNVGVHARFAEQPRWLVEGLAMMFEAPGVWGASATSSRASRTNAGRLKDFLATGDRRHADWIAHLAADDQQFRTDPARAYAESWALSFYLCETRPQEYAAYLARVGRRPQFTEYPPLRRMADFQSSFGADLKTLQSQVQRFIED